VLIGIVGVFIDITERKRAEEELERRVAERTAQLTAANEELVKKITERQRSEQRLATQYAVTRVLAESDTLADATPHLLRAIGESMAWEWGALWNIDRDAGVLRCQSIWHAPNLEAAEFDAISRQTAGMPGPGLKGRVWQSAEPTWIAEATNDPNYMRAPIAAKVGLHGAVAFPILLRGETVGIIEFFSRTVRQPDQEQLAMLSAIGSQIGQFVERKRVEEEQRKLAALVEHSTDFIGIASPEGQVLFVNPAGQKMVGLDGYEQVRTTSLVDYVAEEERERFQEQVLPAVLRDRRWEGETHFRHFQTGAAIQMLHHLFCIKEQGSDRRLALATISRDITERKQAEEALRAANERVAMILDSITDNFFAIDKDWRYTYLNTHAAEQMKVLGKDPARLIGKVLWEEFPNPTSGEHLRRAMSERAVVTDEQYYPPLGEWYENRIYPSPDGGIAVFQRYVTERKRIEEELRRSEAYLVDAQRLSHTGSWAWKVSTGELFWSQEHFRICGLDPEKVKPSYPMALQWIHPEDRSFVQRAFEKAIRERSDFELDCRIVRPDGIIRYVHSLGHPVFNESGVLTEYVGTIIDTTERKQAEEALLKAQAELVHVTRVLTLGALTASIAHEVNQPLAAIVTNGNACLRWLAHEVPELDEARAAVERIIRDSNRASGVIRRIRALAKNTTPQKAWLDLNDVIHEVIALVQSEVHKHRVSLLMELSATLPLVLGDRIQLQQVLLNLMMNGIEAMHPITDRPRELLIRSQSHEFDTILVAVRDSGIGLDPQSMAQLFDAFFTTKPEGMGLGLSISRTIIEAHSGRLWATPNDDHGVTLLFTLPTGGTSV
jgi:PAS domain S-box-containing protein